MSAHVLLNLLTELIALLFLSALCHVDVINFCP